MAEFPFFRCSPPWSYDEEERAIAGRQNAVVLLVSCGAFQAIDLQLYARDVHAIATQEADGTPQEMQNQSPRARFDQLRFFVLCSASPLVICSLYEVHKHTSFKTFFSSSNCLVLARSFFSSSLWLVRSKNVQARKIQQQQIKKKLSDLGFGVQLQKGLVHDDAAAWEGEDLPQFLGRPRGLHEPAPADEVHLSGKRRENGVPGRECSYCAGAPDRATLEFLQGVGHDVGGFERVRRSQEDSCPA
jgi:hypothetical protein